MRHEIKSVQPYFDLVDSGQKTFEIRLNDRCYQKGDVVVIHEFKDGQLTGRSIEATIGTVTNFEQKDGMVVFSLLHLSDCNYYIATKKPNI